MPSFEFCYETYIVQCTLYNVHCTTGIQLKNMHNIYTNLEHVQQVYSCTTDIPMYSLYNRYTASVQQMYTLCFIQIVVQCIAILIVVQYYEIQC